jgi:hypothetical protein
MGTPIVFSTAVKAFEIGRINGGDGDTKIWACNIFWSKVPMK